MNIPSFVTDLFVDKKTGMLIPEWSSVLTQLITELQTNLNNEGYKLPQLIQADIDQLLDGDISTARILYNSTTQKGMINENGTWKTIQTI